MKPSIFKTLEKLNLTSLERLALFSRRKRDTENLQVQKDQVNNIIYRNDIYTGEKKNIDGNYIQKNYLNYKLECQVLEKKTDCTRRFQSTLNLVARQKIVVVF